MKFSFEKKVVSSDDVIKVGATFKNLSILSIDCFTESKFVVYLHSAPFVDEDAYPVLKEAFSASGCLYIDLYRMPIHQKDTYIRILELPKYFQEFNAVMTENNYVYTGGVGISDNNSMQLVSCADTELVTINLTNDVVIDELLAQQSLNILDAQALIDDHKQFLQSGDLTGEA